MIIRNLTLDDDLNKVAELIYQTDPYIYPYWFENYPNWKDIVISLIKSEDSIFYYKNIIVALKNNNIVGIVIYLSYHSNNKFDYTELTKINQNFNYTINKYIQQIHSEVNDINCLYLPNVCVDINYRRRNIGYQMINFIKEKHKKNIILHCLANNTPAINLYLKCGFKKIGRENGFNAPIQKNH